MKNIFTAILFAGALFSISACSTNQKELSDNKETSTTSSMNQVNKEEHIDYDHQDEWEFVSEKMQSPIDIPTSEVENMSPDLGTIVLDYGIEITNAENNGHSIQIEDGGKAEINGRNFELTQFHFHAESEHTIDGKHYPMEVHFVNKAQDGRLAVIGVFFKEGAENKGFQEVLDNVNNGKTEPITDLNEMLPENKSYYHYLGSLTTPPLSENVEWYVMKNSVEVSKEQIKSFKKLYAHNNREIQPLNDRAIIAYTE
ncbi:carbonic anhydrase [Enterococcus sp. LJL128]|uniref:carbonic anhydrase n=1 Tax=Enterococcus sp. LJL51 TaxID=3416656 RepID=UPI003CF99A95